MKNSDLVKQKIANAHQVSERLKELALTDVAESIFESVIENENGKEIQFERPISDVAFAAHTSIDGLIEQTEAAQRRITELESAVIAPGLMRCAGCGFVLTKNNINISAGKITAGDSKTEPCPNGCGPLWPVTWKEQALQAQDDSEKWFEELQDARAELKRRDEAVPAMYIYKGSEKHVWIECGKGYHRGRPVYFIPPAPSAEPVVKLKPIPEGRAISTLPYSLANEHMAIRAMDISAILAAGVAVEEQS